MNIALSIIFAALAVLAWATPAHAQDVPADFCTHPLYQCIHNEDYLSDSHDWQGAGANIEWQAERSFGAFFPSSDAGVLKVNANSGSTSSNFEIRRTVNIPAAQSYAVRLRFATDESWILPSSAVVFVNIIQGGNVYTSFQHMGIAGREEFITRELSGDFYLYGVRFSTGAPLQAGPATVVVRMTLLGPGKSLYIGGFAIGVVGNVGAPLLPTPTVGPTVAVPTPAPAGTDWCAPASAPTLSPGPTPTPNPARFTAPIRDGRTSALWVTQGYTYSVGTMYNYPGSPLGAIALPRRAFGTAFASSAVLAYQGMTPVDPFYVAGYARNVNLGVGETARLIIWTTNDGSTWTRAHTITVGAATQWYPFQVAIAGGSVQAVALSAEHSGGTGEMYVDNVYAYGPASNVPPCNQTTSESPTYISQRWLEYPAEKQCPPSTLLSPNNFWGPLLTEMTLFLDALLAFAPAHEPGSIYDPITQALGNPAFDAVTMLTTLFDLRPVWGGLAVILGFEAMRVTLIMWLIIKRLIPFSSA